MYNLKHAQRKFKRDKNLSIGDVILFGVGYVITDNWKVIDEVIMPAFEEKVKNRQISGDSRFGLPEIFLRHTDPNIRGYGAMLSTSLFKVGQYWSFLHENLVKALKDVAYKDTEIWPKFRASTALIQAERNKEESESTLDLKIDKLLENLNSGIIENPELGPIAKDYIDYIKSYKK